MEGLARALAEAVTVLFGQGGGWTQDQKQAANAFILDASTRKEAFPALLMILSDPAHNLVVKFFASNLLHDKLRKQWDQLLVDEQREVTERLEHMTSTVLPCLAESAEATAYRGRVVLAFCSACIRLSDGLRIGQSAVQGLLNRPDAASYCLAMEVLTRLNEELESADLSRQARADQQGLCQDALPAQLAHVAQVLRQAQPSETVLLSSLSFVHSCCSAKTVTLKALAVDHPQLFATLLACLAPPFNPAAFRQACASCRELAIMREYPPTAASQRARQTMAQSLTTAVRALVPLYQQDRHQTDSLLTCLVDLCETIVVAVCAEQESVVVEAVPAFQELARALVFVSAQRPRALAMLTFDLWAEMENFSDEERSLFFTPVLLRELFPVLLRLVCAPSGTTNESGEPDTFDEEEDRATFRDLRLGLDEVLGLCCESLPEHFFGTLAQAVDAFAVCPAGTATAATAGSQLEAALFVLHACMPRVRSKFAQDNHVLAFLLHSAHVGLTGVERLPPGGCATLSQFLGALASFVFGKSMDSDMPGKQDVHAQALAWTLRQAMVRTGSGSGVVGVAPQGRRGEEGEGGGKANETVSVAARAFHKLVLCCPSALTAAFPAELLPIPPGSGSATAGSLIESVLRYFVAAYAPLETCADAATIVVEALVRAIAALPHHADIPGLLCALASPVRVGLTQLLSTPPSARGFGEAECLCAYLAQMVRFCDAPALSATGAHHAAATFLAQVWPLLEPLITHFGHCTHPQAGRLPTQVFTIYSRTLQALGLHAQSQAASIAQQVTTYLDQPGAIPAASAAFDCAATVGDYYANHLSESLADGRMTGFLTTLQQSLQRRTSAFPPTSAGSPVFLSSVDPAQVLGVDLEGLDAFARCFLAFLSSPRIRPVANGFHATGADLVRSLLATTLLLLRVCSERDPLRSLHSLLQTMFSPSKLSLNFPDSAQHQHALVRTLAGQCPDLIVVLVLELSSPRLGSLVVSNVAEALGAVLAGLCGEGLSEQAGQWLQAAMFREEALCSALDAPARARLGATMLMLAAHQQRRFKALAQDVCKVCCSEATLDVLAAYEDALQG